MTLMIFVLIILEGGRPTGEEFYFRELTSCLEFSDALNGQSIDFPLGGRNRFFESYCRVREIPTADAGNKIQFRDPARTETD
tara:strand:- start:501 stop:746 length:246 start_codon:yes stop_codon:yes gene_type:complete